MLGGLQDFNLNCYPRPLKGGSLLAPVWATGSTTAPEFVKPTEQMNLGSLAVLKCAFRAYFEVVLGRFAAPLGRVVSVR